MKKIHPLLPQTRFFKANLHTHTTVSDGDLSPEEAKKAYKACGYQITGLWVEDNTLRITCSPAQSIRVETQGRLANSVVAAATPLREASLSLEKILSYYGNDPQAFLYVTVTAPNGSYAVTRPYYLTNLQ